MTLVAVLILYLIDGTQAYDDMVTPEVCHALAETYKEGGVLEVPGLLDLQIETARCEEIEIKKSER